MKNNTIDLSTKSNTFTSFLIPHIQTIHLKSYEEIVDLVKSSKDHCQVSDSYIAQVLAKLDTIKHRKSQVMKYMADIILSGSKLAVL